MYHLYVIKQAGDEEELDDWTGKMNETKRTIMSVGADIKMVVNTRIAENNTKIAEVNTKVDTKFAELNTKIELILKNVEPIIEKY